MRLVLRSAFDRYSGYGRDAVDLAMHLQRAGADVHLWPAAMLPQLPREFTDLLTKDPAGRKDALLAFMDPIAMQPWDWPVEKIPRVLGYTMWERLPMLPRDFPNDHARIEVTGRNDDGTPQIAAAVPEGPWFGRELGWSPHGVGGMAVTCEMNVEALSAIDPALDYTVVPCGVDVEQWQPVTRRRDQPVRFLIAGNLAQPRKNLWALLEVWRDLQADRAFAASGATLTVHAFAPGIHPGIVDAYGPGVVFSGLPLSDADMLEMYRAHDVYVAPSRGEGNNKPPMEFAATGGAVIATDWSGHQNWLHRDSCWAVGGELVPADGAPGAVEFEVDRAQLAAALVDAVASRAVLGAKQEAAAGFIASALAWPVMAERMLRWIDRTPAR